MRVGIVVVSHSRKMAEAAVDLAMQMVADQPPAIEVAAGTSDGGIGTDATAVMAAIEAANQGAGVVVITDLGSAVMSAEMALELLDEPDDVRVLAAPFVEGLMAAVVMAATGATLDAVAAEASGAMAPKEQALGIEPAASVTINAPASGASAQVVVVNDTGLHARPAAQIVDAVADFTADVQIMNPAGATSSAASPLGLAMLRAIKGDQLTVTATGPDAEAAVTAVVGLVRDGFGELDVHQGPAAAEPARAAVGVSPGRVVGPAYALHPSLTEEPHTDPPQDVEAEIAELDRALAEVARDYGHRASTTPDKEAASILQATAVLTADATLRDAAVEHIRQHSSATHAMWLAAGDAADSLRAAGGRIAERATDLIDIRNRVVSNLLDLPIPGLPEPGVPFILLAHDLAPSDSANLTSQSCLGIITAEGGPTSHTSILARGMGIPCIVGCSNILSTADGTQVLMDGATGEVIFDPSEEERATAHAEIQPPTALASPGQLADGTPVKLLANTGALDATQKAREAGAEGIGLLRTELCFLDRLEEPTVAEQVATYSEILRIFDGHDVVIRTLDAGSDKPIPFLTLADEFNPALGIRGFRTIEIRPEVLDRQLEAIVAAIRATNTNARVMAPMISVREEAEEFAERARAAGVETVGVMVETPSAAVTAMEILEVVDFLSIGTNDLAQYAMAADRLSATLTPLQDPWQPALLRLIKHVGDAGRELNKPVGVCGEAAADPRLAPVLVGLGISSLSMSPRALHAVGEALAAVTMEQCLAAGEAACAAMTPEHARLAARAALGQ